MLLIRRSGKVFYASKLILFFTKRFLIFSSPKEDIHPQDVVNPCTNDAPKMVIFPPQSQAQSQ